MLFPAHVLLDQLVNNITKLYVYQDSVAVTMSAIIML